MGAVVFPDEARSTTARGQSHPGDCRAQDVLTSSTDLETHFCYPTACLCCLRDAINTRSANKPHSSALQASCTGDCVRA